MGRSKSDCHSLRDECQERIERKGKGDGVAPEGGQKEASFIRFIKFEHVKVFRREGKMEVEARLARPNLEDVIGGRALS